MALKNKLTKVKNKLVEIKGKLNKSLVLTVSITILLLIAYVVILNVADNSVRKYTDVTFISPTQALVFWKSNKPSIGYAKYKEKFFSFSKTVLQTSSEEDQIHVVIFDYIPPKGISISLHEEGKNLFIFPQRINLKYTDYENETN